MGQTINREKLLRAALTAAVATAEKQPSILARLFATIASLDFGYSCNEYWFYCIANRIYDVRRIAFKIAFYLWFNMWNDV